MCAARPGRETPWVSVSGFVMCLALGAGALALWVDVRFPGRVDRNWKVVFCHLFAAGLVIQLVMPEAGMLVRDSGTAASYPLAAVGVALPSLTYLFLASLWVLKLAQRQLPGQR
jgi:hypothetical protein